MAISVVLCPRWLLPRARPSRSPHEHRHRVVGLAIVLLRRLQQPRRTCAEIDDLGHQERLRRHAGLGHLPLQPLIDQPLVRRVLGMVDRNEYKRRQAAPGLRVSSKAFGVGRRIPIVMKRVRHDGDPILESAVEDASGAVVGAGGPA